jgi:photosystem II stability/assembly factor-like uncharacterized protein
MYGWQDPCTQGAFGTRDNGVTFQSFLNMGPKLQSHSDSISIDFTDPDRKTILSGGHEQKVSGGEGLFLSTTGGADFDEIMNRLPTDVGFCTLALVLDAQNLLVGCPASWSGNPGAIVRSGDGGTTWTKVHTAGVSTAWGAHPLWAKDGAIYWPAENSGLLKSTDQGKTWSAISGARNIKHAPLELPDGRILSATASQIVVTADGGSTWTPAGPALPAEGGFAYSIMAKTLFVWKGGCKTAGWDYTK